tara:strand:+ start:16115 stop:16486 length:372 start_codon:yes stop_codon:yes gene_type:complete
MSKVEKIKSFNEILETFLQQLSPIIGTTYHFYFQKLVKANAVMPIQQFLLEVIPFKEKIMNKDESYFLDIESNAEDKIQGDEQVLTEILRLKDIYSGLDNQSRQEVWNYFQALIVLSEEYSTC